MQSDSSEQVLRAALEENGHRFTEQRAAVYRYLSETRTHPTADQVFLSVRNEVPGISLATVYKSLETLVGCGLATKLAYADGSARYDGRTDPHHHARCVSCDRVFDVPGTLSQNELESLREGVDAITITGYRLEFTGFCPDCESVEAKESAETVHA
ncbi:MAG: transcriptional repressor [Longimicrobiales bacterium]|nr:transcriptional repressor [Longimicrobiales bacterium]